MDLRNLIISPEGRVFAESEEQDAFIELDQINLVRFDDPQRLVKEPGTYFRYEGAPEAIRPAMEAQVGQGYLESSNVDVFQTMVTMIDLLRGYEAYQKPFKRLTASMEPPLRGSHVLAESMKEMR